MALAGVSRYNSLQFHFFHWLLLLHVFDSIEKIHTEQHIQSLCCVFDSTRWYEYLRNRHPWRNQGFAVREEHTGLVRECLRLQQFFLLLQ